MPSFVEVLKSCWFPLICILCGNWSHRPYLQSLLARHQQMARGPSEYPGEGESRAGLSTTARVSYSVSIVSLGQSAQYSTQNSVKTPPWKVVCTWQCLWYYWC